MTLTLAFVMDPIERVNINTDTSFAFMLEAHRRGHRVVHVAPSAVSLEHDRVFFWGQAVALERTPGAHYRVRERVRLEARDCAAVFIRTDPPFDDAYLTVTWMLSFAEAQGVLVINSPTGLRNANEHLYSLMFPDLCPPTLVTSDRREIAAFVTRVGGNAIAKPIDGHGGFGVVRLTSGDTNLNALADLLTREGRRAVMVQEFVRAEQPGDKRLFMVDGVLRGAVRRQPPEGDHRGNIHIGGKAQRCELTAADRALEAAMGERLRKDGLYFVGLDVIGDRLIEVNVTSPTLIQELRDLGGPDLAVEVIDHAERSVGA